MLLDTASNGNFLNKEVDDGWELVENLSAADGNYGEDYDRNHRGTADPDSISKKEMKSLHERLDKLTAVDAKLDKLLQAQSRKQVNLVYDEELAVEEEEGQIEEVSYMQNQGNFSQQQGNFRENQGQYNQYKPNPNFSYRSNNASNPSDQAYPPRPFVPRQQFNNNSNNNRVPQTTPPGYQHPQAAPPSQAQQPPAQSSDITAMFQQLLQGQTSMHADINRKIDASHNELNTKFEQLNSRLKYVESQQASSSVKISGQLPGKAVQNPKEYTAMAITLRRGREIIVRAEENPVTEDSEVQVGEDNLMTDDSKQHISTSTGSSPRPEPSKAKVKTNPTAAIEQTPEPASGEVEQPTAQNVIPAPDCAKTFVWRSYKPQLPFPQRFKEDAIKERIQEVEGMVVLTHEVSAVIQNTTVQKNLGDPGTFTIPCSIGPLSFNSCICDLGASISVMPLSVAKKLGFEKFKPCNRSLTLADRSIRHPEGLLEDMPVRVGNADILTDFIVLDMCEEPKDPLLLGRPFLATAGAVINVQKGEIEFNLFNGLKMAYNVNDCMKKPDIGEVLSDEEIPEATVVYLDIAPGVGEKENFEKEDAQNLSSAQLGDLGPQPFELNLGPDIDFIKVGYVNGVAEYKVRGTSSSKPFNKVRDEQHHEVERPLDLLNKVRDEHHHEVERPPDPLNKVRDEQHHEVERSPDPLNLISE